MTRLRMLAPKVQNISTSAIKAVPKIKNSFYDSPAFRAWRTQVVARAGARCEAVDNGQRCTKAWPQHRMYADHVHELRDGGAALDPANGQCLCASHHEIKTHNVRRMGPAWTGSPTKPNLPRPSCRVMLVCGPPAAGKTTHVRAYAKPDDLIIDLDAIADDYGVGRVRADDVLLSLLHKRNDRLAALAREPAERVAWVIVSAPTHKLRQWWCSALGVQANDVVLLVPPRSELHRRAMNDPARTPFIDQHLLWIDGWLARETGHWPEPITNSNAGG